MVYWILRNFALSKNSFEAFDEIWMNVALERWGIEPESVKIATRLRTWARHKN